MLACPFCHRTFARQGFCADCEIGLVEPAEEEEAPLAKPLPWHSLAHGRGALIFASAIGLTLFFVAPWVHERAPELRQWTGAELAARLGWIWGAPVAWFVLLPLVASRRSVGALRGAWFSVMMLGAIASTVSLVRVIFPPSRPLHIPLSYAWGWGLWANAALGIIACALGWRLSRLRM